MKISKMGKSRAFMLAALTVLVLALHVPAYAVASKNCYEVEGNPTGMVEFRFENPMTGQYVYGDITVDIVITDGEMGPTFSFTSSAPVSRVVAKGGEGGAMVCDYDPPVLTDSGLHAPMNPSEKWAGLSWIGFNFEEPEEPEETEEPEEPEEPLTPEEPEEPEEPSLPFTEEEEEESLPFTGGELVLLLGAGLAATTGITLRRIGK